MNSEAISLTSSRRTVFMVLNVQKLGVNCCHVMQVKNETHALWTWHRNQDKFSFAGDVIYIVRQPEKCPVKAKVKYSRSDN